MNEMDENCEGILPGQAVNIMKCDVVQIEFIYLIKFTLIFFFNFTSHNLYNQRNNNIR